MSKREKPPEIPADRIDKRVSQYLMLRDKVESIEERHKAELKPFNEAKDRLVGELLEVLDLFGLKSAKTEFGTVSVKVYHTSPLSDPDAFMDFVRENDAYELMDRRANSTAVREYAEEHEGLLPPGVKINSRRTIGVTKS